MQNFRTLTRAPNTKPNSKNMPNLFDIPEIASRCGITDKLCAEIILGKSHAMKGSINAMISGTTHRKELETAARELVK